MRSVTTTSVLGFLCLCCLACGGSDERVNNAATAIVTPDRPKDDGGRCDPNAPNREMSEYDTSGDDYPDVRKVFVSIGEGRLRRLVLICREADLDGNGSKDVVRYYSDEGRPTREEADRDFDGTMDEVTYFDAGKIIRQEMDSTHNGQVDTKIFFEKGRPYRAERDIAGRSSATEWKPDRWEYFEDGHMVRMGTDLDGDGSVDRWDRNAVHHQKDQSRIETPNKDEYVDDEPADSDQ